MSILSNYENQPCLQEDRSRPQGPSLMKLLEIDCLDHHSQDRALHTLQRSARILLQRNNDAAGLIQFLQSLQSARALADQNKQTARTTTLSASAMAAITQPAASLPLTAHSILLSCWGLIIYSCWVKGIPVPQDLSSGWRKLAQGKIPAWKNLAGKSIDYLHGIDAAIVETTSEVTKKFLHSLRQLVAEVSFTFTSTDNVLGNVFSPAQPTKARDAEIPPLESVFGDGEAHSKQVDHEYIASSSVALAPSIKINAGHFIPWQLVQASHLPGLDGYALSTRWEALHPSELLRCCRRLCQALNSIDQKQRLTAAICLTEPGIGLPPQLLFQVQFKQFGDTWIDLEYLCIKRNLGAIAPRKDKASEAGEAQNWRSVPMVPAAARIILDAARQSPASSTVGELCDTNGVTLAMMRAMLSEGDDTSHSPEPARFARSLGLFLVHAGVSPVVAAQATGDWSLCPTNDHYYLRADDHIFIDAIGIFCRAINVAPPKKLPQNNFAGSPYCPGSDEVRLLFECISSDIYRQRVKLPSRSRVADYIAFQNIFQLACAAHFVFLTQHRGSRLTEARWEHIDFENMVAMICDKESDEYSARRLVPLVDSLIKTLKYLWSHQRAVVDRFRKSQLSGEIATSADAIAKMQCHLFFQIKINSRTKRYYTSPVDHKDLDTFLKSYSTRPVNMGRHYGFSQLVLSGVAPVAINAMSGRHTNGAEPFGLVGRLSPLETLAYLRPELEKVLESVQQAPLVGLGSTRKRDLKLTQPPPPYSIQPPVNDYLRSRLNAEDLLPFEIMHTQRCPFTSDTLAASRYVDSLRKAFVKSDLVGIDPGTALVFSLVVFDAVVNEIEINALYGAALEHPQRVGEAAFAEVKRGGVVTTIRQLSKVTVACQARLIKLGATVSRTWLRQSMIDILQKLDPHFSYASAKDPLRLLINATSHWVLLHVAPTEQFPIFAGARSMSVEDVARGVLKKPGLDIYWPALSSRKRKERNLSALTQYVRHFASKDLRLGETKRRRNSLARVVKALKDTIVDQESGTYWACQWVLSECLAPASNDIKVGTIYSYLQILHPIFNSPLPISDFDAEDWISKRKTMLEGRRPDAIGDVEGALMHLACYARSIGLEVPAYFLRGHPKLGQVPLRQPIMIFAHEIEQARTRVSQLQVPWNKLAAVKNRFTWESACRPIEASNLSTRDISGDGQLAHIVPAGFDHLKTAYTCGTISIESPEFRQILVETARLQRAAPRSGDRPLMFRSESADQTFQIDSANLTAMRIVTGKAQFTHRDLRASGITHSVEAIEPLLDRLMSTTPLPAPCLTTFEIGQKSASMARAVRRGRHSISFPTTQRRYDVGGSMRLAGTLRQQDAKLEIGAAFIAATSGKTKCAIDVALHRADSSITTAEKSWSIFVKLLSPHIRSFPEPALGTPISPSNTIVHSATFESAAWSMLMWLYGLEEALTEHVTGLPAATLRQIVRDCEKALGFPLVRDSPGSGGLNSPKILSSIPVQKFWKGVVSHRAQFAQRGRILFGFQSRRGALSLPSQAAAFEAATLLACCIPEEWKVTVVAPHGYELERRAELSASLAGEGIELETRVSTRVGGWAIRVGPANVSRHAPRAIGEINTLVRRGALIASFVSTI